MKTLLAAVMALTATVSFAQDKPMVTSYKIDPVATKIVFVGKKITGQHTGTVSVKSGDLKFVGDTLTGGEVIVDINSITNADITDKETNAKFVGHMKSPDFFHTEKYPEAKLTIKNSKKTAKGLEVIGDLTLVGKTNPISFIVTNLKKTDSKVSAKTKLTVNRTKWGLVYGSGSFIKGLGDKAINDEFTLDIDLEATK